MKLLPAGDLVIPPNRQRRDFDPEGLAELGQSILQNQLLQALVVRQAAGGLHVLVAGERRLRAIRDYIWMPGESYFFEGVSVPEGLVPCVDLGELDPLQAEEAELEENIRRVDLTVEERCRATARLFDLRNKQAEAAGKPPVTVRDLTQELHGGEAKVYESGLGDAQTRTRNEIILGRHMDDPEVRAAKSVKEGMKILKRREVAKRNVELADKIGPTLTSASHTILNEDGIEWLEETAEEGLYDIICTDQPFGMDADRFGDSGGKAAGAHGYADDYQTFLDCRQALLDHGMRITKPQAHLYWFCDIDNFVSSRELFEAAGWWVHRTPLVWHKGAGPRVPWPEHGPRRCYELILFAIKGKRPAARAGMPDVISIPTEENLGNPAQKPVALYTELLRRSARPGDRVLDPFAGTGPILPAAHELKCLATAIDKDPAQFGIMAGRIARLDEPQPDLLEKI